MRTVLLLLRVCANLQQSRATERFTLKCPMNFLIEQAKQRRVTHWSRFEKVVKPVIIDAINGVDFANVDSM